MSTFLFKLMVALGVAAYFTAVFTLKVLYIHFFTAPIVFFCVEWPFFHFSSKLEEMMDYFQSESFPHGQIFLLILDHDWTKDNELAVLLLTTVAALIIFTVLLYVQAMFEASFIFWPACYLATGCNGILVASWWGDLSLVRFFCALGGDVNAKDDEGTALHVACSTNNLKLISFLIRRGADLNVEDRNEKTPLLKLDPRRNGFSKCLGVMINELSRLSFESLPVPQKDMAFIRRYQKSQEYFEECLSEIDRMKNDKIYKFYSYHSVLNKTISVRKLAFLAKNERISRGWPYHNYSFDLRVTFEEALAVRNKYESTFLELKSTMGGVFPDVVLRRLADSFTFEKEPVKKAWDLRLCALCLFIILRTVHHRLISLVLKLFCR